MKKWRVVLDAAKAPTCGDWVAVSGLCPGEEETARFLFLDGREADGFTFLDAPQEQVGNSPSGEQVPWLHFPDCMEIVGVQISIEPSRNPPPVSKFLCEGECQLGGTIAWYVNDQRVGRHRVISRLELSDRVLNGLNGVEVSPPH
ncbi:MAG TPA: hypothetical protein PLT27_09155 [Nitrospira sp.]|nr:hypothetical protein [Nitrospira sp.]